MLDSSGAFPSMAVCAKMLHVSPKTLTRRLSEEGTSFREIRDTLRKRLSNAYLKIRKISIQETAYMLGYSDSANFRRAFRRWLGIPPN
jgi:AraC-like DNA-binding protein